MQTRNISDWLNELINSRSSYYNHNNFSADLSWVTSPDTDLPTYTERKPVSYIDKDGQTRTMIADVKYYGPMHDPIFTVAVECDEPDDECYCESLL